MLINMANWVRDCKDDVLGVNTSVQKTLYQTVCVESTSIDHTVCCSASVSEGVHERTALLEVLVKVWVIYGKDSLSLLDLLV